MAAFWSASAARHFSKNGDIVFPLYLSEDRGTVRIMDSTAEPSSPARIDIHVTLTGSPVVQHEVTAIDRLSDFGWRVFVFSLRCVLGGACGIVIVAMIWLVHAVMASSPV